jgi:hypothetical protein
MNFNDDLRAADTVLDHRLYAAGNALREASATQVDATSALRVILLHADPAPEEPDGQPAPSTSATSSLRRPQRRLALPSTCCWCWPSASGFWSGCSGARTSAT